MNADRPQAVRERMLVLACGALVNELQAIIGTAGRNHVEPSHGGFGHVGLSHIDIECLPAKLHNRPALIAGAIRERLARLQSEGRCYRRILLGYADCGTAGALDELCTELASEDGLSVTRVPGAHCYEFFSTQARFAELSETEPATFYLTDYLARHFDLLVWKGLGIADHPELAELYFGNYRRVVLLTQTPDDAQRAHIEAYARAGADRLGLPLELIATGYGDLEAAVAHTAMGAPSAVSVQPPRTVSAQPARAEPLQPASAGGGNEPSVLA